MDIFKIGRTHTQPLTSTSSNKTKTKENSDRDPNQGGQYSRGEEPASKEEAEKAATQLRGSTHFLANNLSVEVREAEGKYFLDIFDPQKRKIKTISAVGIRAILSSYNPSAKSTRILDRRV